MVGFNVMHTKMELVLPCVQALRKAGWTGPIGAARCLSATRNLAIMYDSISH